MTGFDHRIQEGLNDEDFDTDMAASWEYDATVEDIRGRVEFASRSAVASHAAAGDYRTGDRLNEASDTNLRQPPDLPVIPSTCFG